MVIEREREFVMAPFGNDHHNGHAFQSWTNLTERISANGQWRFHYVTQPRYTKQNSVIEWATAFITGTGTYMKQVSNNGLPLDISNFVSECIKIYREEKRTRITNYKDCGIR